MEVFHRQWSLPELGHVSRQEFFFFTPPPSKVIIRVPKVDNQFECSIQSLVLELFEPSTLSRCYSSRLLYNVIQFDFLHHPSRQTTFNKIKTFDIRDWRRLYHTMLFTLNSNHRSNFKQNHGDVTHFAYYTMLFTLILCAILAIFNESMGLHGDVTHFAYYTMLFTLILCAILAIFNESMGLHGDVTHFAYCTMLFTLILCIILAIFNKIMVTWLTTPHVILFTSTTPGSFGNAKNISRSW